MATELYTSENTLAIIHDALERAGLSEKQIINTIFDMQNHGIYFREMVPEKDVETGNKAYQTEQLPFFSHKD